MDDSTTVKWLSKAIGQATRSAKFCVIGCLPGIDPDIEVEGLGTVALLLKRGVAKDLVLSKTRGSFERAVKRFEANRRLLSGLPVAR